MKTLTLMNMRFALIAMLVIAGSFGMALFANAAALQVPSNYQNQCLIGQQYFSQVNCTQNPDAPQQCMNPPSVTVMIPQSTNDLLIQYSTINYGYGPDHCSSVGVDIWIDGRGLGNTPFIPPSSVSDFIHAGPVTAGLHVFTIKGTGTPGGCNHGALSTWGGTLNFATAGLCSVAPATTPTCSANADCGSNGYTGGNFCQGNGVYRNYQTWTCNNPGAANSYCSSNSAAQLQTTCSNNQTCGNGTCNNTNTGTVACSSNSQCGTSGVTGANFCSGNSVYQNNVTWTCNNPGTTNSYCSSSTSQQLQITCSGNQTCSNGSCTNNTATCTTHSYTQCSNNAVYWYNSCGQQQEVYTVCGNGQTCSGNTCVNNNNQTANLVITKQVRNLSAGNLTWANSVNAAPGDILQVQITLQNTGTQTINNVTVRDTLPANISYYNNLFVDGTANNGNITSGVNIGAINANQTRVITYQIQIAPAANFSLGTTTLTNSITVTADNGFNSTGPGVTIYVTRSSTSGATGAPTGLTNNPFIDSFFLPLVLALGGLWLWKSGYLGALGFAGLAQKASTNKLMAKIAEVQKRENA